MLRGEFMILNGEHGRLCELNVLKAYKFSIAYGLTLWGRDSVIAALAANYSSITDQNLVGAHAVISLLRCTIISSNRAKKAASLNDHVTGSSTPARGFVRGSPPCKERAYCRYKGSPQAKEPAAGEGGPRRSPLKMRKKIGSARGSSRDRPFAAQAAIQFQRRSRAVSTVLVLALTTEFPI